MRHLLVLALLVAVLPGCGDDAPADADSRPEATAACGPVETIPIQGEGHLVGDQEPPVPYNSTPPTSGWHTSGDVPIEVFSDDDPLTEPEQVTVLELGGVLASYGDLSANERDALARLATAEYPGRLAVTRYDALGPGTVALTAWGRVQHCDALDLDAVAAFVEAYAGTV